mgnify:CR=1 FL=1
MSELTNTFNQQAREAEKAVLGGLMLETERFDSVILKISYKDLQEANLIFTRVDKLIFLEVEYEIISQHGNYVLLETRK